LFFLSFLFSFDILIITFLGKNAIVKNAQK